MSALAVPAALEAPPRSRLVAAAALHQVVVLVALLFPGLMNAVGLVPRLAVGFMAILFLPGWLILWRWGTRPRAWDAIPFAFAVSLLFVTGMTILSIETHLNSRWGALVVVAASLAIAAREWWRPAAAGVLDDGCEDGDDATAARRVLEWTLVVGIGLLMAVLLTVGGTMRPDSIGDLEEEALHLSILRKLTENAALDHFNVMYKAGVANTYVYPPYHFALALVARVSALDPLVVYLKFRPVAALVALLSLRSLTALFFGRRWVADVALLSWLVLVVNNTAGQVPGFYWAQLVPLSHLGDFGLGVMLPLLLLFTFHYLRAEPTRTPFAILTPALVFVALLVHTREVLQLLVFLGSAALGLFLFRRHDRRMLARLLALIAAAVVMGLLYQLRHGALAGHAVLFEAANREAFRGRLNHVLREPFWRVVMEPNQEFYGLMSRGLYLLPLVLLPLLWLARRWSVLLVAPGLLACALIIRIPHLSLQFILHTYAEILQTPARNFVHWGLLLLGGGLGLLALGLEKLYASALNGASLRVAWTGGRPMFESGWRAARSRPEKGALALVVTTLAAGAGGLIVWGLRRLESTSTQRIDAVYVVAIVGSLVALAARAAWASRFGPSPREIAYRRVQHPWIALAAAVASIVPLFSYGSPPSLRAQYRQWSRLPSMADFWNWYNASAFAAKVPAAAVRFLREQVPPGRVLAAPKRFGFTLPVLTNHYIISTGFVLSSDLDVVEPYERVTGSHRRFDPHPFRGYQERSAYAREIVEFDPMFHPHVPPEQTLAYLREYGVEYVVVGPRERVHYRRLAESFPGVLERLFAKQDHVVYRVHREGLPARAVGP
jgi:hypothetical protein